MFDILLDPELPAQSDHHSLSMLVLCWHHKWFLLCKTFPFFEGVPWDFVCIGENQHVFYSPATLRHCIMQEEKMGKKENNLHEKLKFIYHRFLYKLID